MDQGIVHFIDLKFRGSSDGRDRLADPARHPVSALESGLQDAGCG
jgi:hypothetical protein